MGGVGPSKQEADLSIFLENGGFPAFWSVGTWGGEGGIIY